MVGAGLPRAGQYRLTVLLALTVTSSTSSSVSPRITGGAGGGEKRVRSGQPPWERPQEEWGVETRALGARWWLGLLEPCPPSPSKP